jgi:transposase-like protein
VPRVIITDKLKSYAAAKRGILPGVEHRQHKGLNNRAENSHQPTRLREKKMRRFRISEAGPTLSLSLWTHCWAFPATQTPLMQKANTVLFYRANSWSGTR